MGLVHLDWGVAPVRATREGLPVGPDHLAHTVVPKVATDDGLVRLFHAEMKAVIDLC